MCPSFRCNTFNLVEPSIQKRKRHLSIKGKLWRCFPGRRVQRCPETMLSGLVGTMVMGMTFTFPTRQVSRINRSRLPSRW